MLILVFIFLTPKGWFENSAFQRTHMGPATVAIPVDVVGSELDRVEIERRTRLKTGRSEALISDPRPLRDAAGELIGYEVDIR